MSGLPDYRPYLAFEGFVTKSLSSLAIKDLIHRLASLPIPVLLTGESGTGKTTIAHVIHSASRRRDSPIVAFSCAALSADMEAAELFGLGRGTGSAAARQGLIDQARGGTLLFEEVTALSRPLQQKLVHLLQYGKFHRVGDSSPIAADVRIMATATEDLTTAVSSNRFGPDLFYRLSVGQIDLSPLRQRPEEIPVLIDYFLTILSQRHSKPAPAIPLETLRAFMDYGWPGNVRELEMRLERCVSLGEAAIPPRTVPHLQTSLDLPNDLVTLQSQGQNLTDYTDAIEKRLIQQALTRTNGNQTSAAELLGLTFRQFRYKLQKLHLTSAGETRPPRSK